MGIAVQPQIDASYRLLHAGFVFDGLALDLYGTADADGAEVCAAALAGSTVDIEAITCSALFQRAQDFIDTRSVQQLEQDRQQARVEHFLFERMTI